MKPSALRQPATIPRYWNAARLRRNSCSSNTSISSLKTLKASNRDLTSDKKTMQFEPILNERNLAIFNELWDVLSDDQKDALLHCLYHLQRHPREDGNITLRRLYIAPLHLEFQLFPIQDIPTVTQFLAMVEGLGANAIGELIQMIHPIEFVIPENHGEDFDRQDHGMDFDNASVHTVSSTNDSDGTTSRADSSRSNADA